MPYMLSTVSSSLTGWSIIKFNTTAGDNSDEDEGGLVEEVPDPKEPFLYEGRGNKDI